MSTYGKTVQDALRDKIARALKEYSDSQDTPEERAMFGDQLTVEDFHGEADAVLAVLDLDQLRAAAQVQALREAKQEVRASSFWADGSDNYADRVRGWLSNRADRIAREAGISVNDEQENDR